MIEFQVNARAPRPPASQARVRQQRAWGLVEVLVCSLVLSAGMVLMLKGHAALREHSDYARDRSAAAVLAEAQVERLRSQVLTDPLTDQLKAQWSPSAAQELAPDRPMRMRGWSDPPAEASSHDTLPARARAPEADAALALQEDWQLDHDSTLYVFHQQLSGETPGQLRDLDLQVRWQDRSGSWQPLRWPARLARRQPWLPLVALSRPPPGDVVPSAGRHAAVPVNARSLNERWAVFQPDPGTTLAWLVDVRSGMVQGLCELGDRHVDDLRAADVADCRSRMGAGGAWLISGQIRFDMSPAPSSETPHSPALPGGVTLVLEGDPQPTTLPRCASNAADAALKGRDVVSYHCLVAPRRRDGRWSGRVELSGTMADLGRFRVCRYSADHDHDGRISNIEHPARYADVDGPLLQQNFLVIRTDLSCPAGRASDPRAGRLLDTTTVSHQPPG